MKLISFLTEHNVLFNSLKDDFTNNMEETDIKFEVSNYFNKYQKNKKGKSHNFTDAELKTRKKSLESKTIDDVEFILNILDFKRYSDINNSLDEDTEIEINIPDLDNPLFRVFRAFQVHRNINLIFVLCL